MKMLYRLDHVYTLDDHIEKKHIGIFSSMEKAKHAIELVENKPGFCDYTDGFTIRKRWYWKIPRLIDKPQRSEGFWEDHQIKASITSILEGTPYELTFFKRDHMCFGNMIAKIKIGKHEHQFASDRGDIFRNDTLVFPCTYHMAREDDSPKYFLKAIEQYVR